MRRPVDGGGPRAEMTDDHVLAGGVATGGEQQASVVAESPNGPGTPTRPARSETRRA
jgi:hypothetical protein